MEKRPRGRPTKEDQLRFKHPADRLRSLREEMNCAIDFLLEHQDKYYASYVSEDEDTRMALQQLSSRADTLITILMNLKVWLCLAHSQPTRLL